MRGSCDLGGGVSDGLARGWRYIKLSLYYYTILYYNSIECSSSRCARGACINQYTITVLILLVQYYSINIDSTLLQY